MIKLMDQLSELFKIILKCFSVTMFVFHVDVLLFFFKSYVHLFDFFLIIVFFLLASMLLHLTNVFFTLQHLSASLVILNVRFKFFNGIYLLSCISFKQK